MPSWQTVRNLPQEGFSDKTDAGRVQTSRANMGSPRMEHLHIPAVAETQRPQVSGTIFLRIAIEIMVRNYSIESY